MRRLFLSSLVFVLFCSMVVGAGLASATSTPAGASDVPMVKVKPPPTGTSHRYLSHQGPASTNEPGAPIILTPAYLAEDEVLTEWEKRPYSGKPNVPDPNLILQGGDDIAGATVIPSLPYSDAGTTEGYTDDYDESCPDPSAAPDVVYSYSPGGDETVDIYVWGYDTKLFLYENSYTPGDPFACNDDFFYYGQSALQDLDLTGGNTYYIVIDGYGDAFGDYEFEMLLSPARPVGNYCADAEHNTLESGVIYTYDNDSRYALDTDDWFPGPEVFISFTVPFEMDVTLDMCESFCEGYRWGS